MTRYALSVATALVFSASTFAQVGPSLAIDTWDAEPHLAKTVDEPYWISGGHDKRSGLDIDIFYWDSVGRVKLDKQNADPDFWLGYRILIVDVSSDINNLPDELFDTAIVGGFKIGESEDWTWSLIAGGGSANDSHYSNTDALYGIVNLNGTRRLDENSKLHVGVNYDGNRTFLPDVPLPYIVYEHKVDDTLSYRLGVPDSGVVWRPLEQWVFQAEYHVPTNLSASAAYWFTENVSVFSEYKQTIDGFYLDGQDDKRIFYEFSRFAGGVHLVWQPYIDAKIGAGWAFDQEFSTGFDVRDSNTFVEPSDEVLFFFTLKGTF